MASGSFQFTEDTQVTLLLCAPLVAAKQKEVAPLSPGEFNEVSARVTQHGFRLAQFLDTADAKAMIEHLGALVEPGRLEALLGRGFMLSLCLERWVSAGLWIKGRTDEDYPRRLRDRLKQHAPAVLYGCGNGTLLDQGGVAIVGSRDVDEAGTEFTQQVARSCARERLNVISGGARGVDQIAMLSALDEGGTVVGVLADSLARSASSGKVREPIQDGRLALVSPFDPEAGFNVGNAMNRNKYIYALGDYGVVVSAGLNEGGTWTGAIEQLEKFHHVPVFVRMDGAVPDGNRQLVKRGAVAFPEKPWPDSLVEAFTRLAPRPSGLMETGDLFATQAAPSPSERRP